MSRPKWCEDYSKVVEFGDWLLHKSGEWDHLPARDKCEELLSYFDKPWNYDEDYQLYSEKMFRCASCDALEDVETDEQADAVANKGDGPNLDHGLHCAECDAERRAESYAASNPYFGGWR